LKVKRLISKNFVKTDEEKPLFQLFFLKDNEDHSVKIEEVEEIDFRKVKKHLEQRESVFITLKRKKKLETSLVAREDATESWYFDHI